ncbi:hypothetical protein J6590_071937, partial [Homalodisca vitripennis]
MWFSALLGCNCPGITFYLVLFAQIQIIQIVSGVILVAWREKVLERQIDYGAKLGHVVLGLARMELSNFYKNVVPVADYYDQRGMLIAKGLTLMHVDNGARTYIATSL